jgi:thioesterase domain-containing protein
MNPTAALHEPIAPRNVLEFQLSRIWEDLFGRSPIGIDEDFFELGGESLLAMTLLARIAQDIGCSVPAAGIFQARTIEKLARVLDDASEPVQWSPLVPIRTQGTKPPFFCVHPSGGNVLCYLQLSRHLGEDQPFYGLECRGHSGHSEPLTSAKEMAGEYVAALRSVQPSGPYSLGGWSIGGVLAFEMAQQLRAAGEQIRLLALIDSGVLYCVALLTALFPDKDLGLFDVMRLDPAERLIEFRRRSAPARLIPQNADDDLARRIMNLFVANMRAVMTYPIESYDRPLTLFQAFDPIVKPRFQPGREWASRCTNLDVIAVPGSHLTMIHEPHVAVLADELRRCLDNA